MGGMGVREGRAAGKRSFFFQRSDGLEAMRRCPTPARESLKSLLESLRSFLVFPKGVPETSKTSFPEFRAVGRLQQGAYMFEGSLGWGLGVFRWHIMI